MLDLELDDQSDRRPPSHWESMKRRAFTLTGIGSLVAVAIAWTAGLVRYMFPRIRYEPPTRFVAGFPESYRPGEVDTKWQKDHRVWIVRRGDGIYAILANCTHLGCTPSWFGDERLFKCPCHGSNFTQVGDPVAGPAPSPLYRVSLSIGPDGQLIVDKAIQENRPGHRDRPPFRLTLDGNSRGDVPA